MLHLKRLDKCDGMPIYEMLQEIRLNDNGFHNSVYGMDFDQFKVWLVKEYARDNGDLEDWMVPQSSYWLFDGNRPVGYGRIRHFLNEKLRENSGHIGYAIRESERGRGFGNQILAFLLHECLKLGISEVQIGANADNLPSNKVILFNGGTPIRSANGKNFYTISL